MEFEGDELLSEDFLRKLERLRLLTKRTIKGPQKGEHRSWRSGTSLEFLDYRKYQPGDDIRYVDWNVYGRLDKLFLKLFRAEEDLSVYFLIDCSRSMASGNPPKMLFCLKTAAALGYLALAEMDQVGLVSFSDRLQESTTLVKGKKAYFSLLRFLNELKIEGKTGVSASLGEFAVSCPRSGLAVVLSDLLDEKGLEKGLEALRQRKFRIVLIQILNHEELHPSWQGFLSLKDMESQEKKKITLSTELLELYPKRMEAFLKGIRELGLAYGAEYLLLDTRIPFEDFIFGGILEGRLFR